MYVCMYVCMYSISVCIYKMGRGWLRETISAYTCLSVCLSVNAYIFMNPNYERVNTNTGNDKLKRKYMINIYVCLFVFLSVCLSVSLSSVSLLKLMGFYLR